MRRTDKAAMSLLSRLRDAFDELTLPPGGAVDDTRLTVAALLILVARVDGTVLPVEEEGLRALLRSRFAIDDEEAADLLAEADEIERDVDEAKALVARIVHDIEPEELPRLLALAYRVAGIDGFLHEFEDDLLWRIGRLLGLSDAAVTAVREGALQNLAPQRGRRG